LLLAAVSVYAQDLEPRRWSPLPPGMNVFGTGVGVSEGDIFFDPALQIEDAEVNAETLGISYVRSFRLGNRLARIDFVQPWQHAHYKGLLEGAPASTTRVGLMDPTVRLSVILAGAEPDPTAKSNTVVGAAFAVIAPLGEYSQRFLINLGQNRWVFRPQVGFVHTRGQWSYELTGSLFFFTDNDEFYQGATREQDPLFALQGHVIYARRKRGHWAALSLGYGGNGQSIIDGNRVDDDQRQSLAALSYGFPLGTKQTLKFAYVRSRTNTSKGSDVDTLAISWSTRF
jgi:hypothetical protein